MAAHRVIPPEARIPALLARLGGRLMTLLNPLSRWCGKQRSHVGQRTHLRTLHDGLLKVRRWTVAVRINVMCDARRGHVDRRTARNKQHAAPESLNAIPLVGCATASAKPTESARMHSSRRDKSPRLNQELAKALEELGRNITFRILVRRVEPTNRKTARVGSRPHILTDGKVGVMCHALSWGLV
jgi:hypothetical protein